MFANAQLIYDNSIASTLTTRFESEIRDLEKQGFVSDGVLEVVHYLPLAPAALAFGIMGREVWEWQFPFNIKWYHPVMRSRDGTSVAYPFGIGVRYYTFFDDGSTQRTSACQDEESKQYRNRCRLFIANLTEKDIDESWVRHLSFVDELKKYEGKTPLRSNYMNRLATMQTEEDTWQEQAFMCLLGWGVIVAAIAIATYLIRG